MQARIANAKAEDALRLSKEQEDIVRRARALEAEAEEHWRKAKEYGNKAGKYITSPGLCIVAPITRLWCLYDACMSWGTPKSCSTSCACSSARILVRVR
jgi:hypothetical protein